jgi:3-dehydroquinate dehydratase
LVVGMKDINDTARELKKEELALEMTIHQENLRYNQEKDKVLLENLKLALMNQSAVVAAMTSLADAIRSVRTPIVNAKTTPPNHGTTNTIADRSMP